MAQSCRLVLGFLFLCSWPHFYTGIGGTLVSALTWYTWHIPASVAQLLSALLGFLGLISLFSNMASLRWHSRCQLCTGIFCGFYMVVPASAAHLCQLCPGLLGIDFNPASVAQSLSSLLNFLAMIYVWFWFFPASLALMSALSWDPYHWIWPSFGGTVAVTFVLGFLAMVYMVVNWTS